MPGRVPGIQKSCITSGKLDHRDKPGDDTCGNCSGDYRKIITVGPVSDYCQRFESFWSMALGACVSAP